MKGSSPSNCTSTTAPRTWVTRPTMLLAIGRCSSSPESDGFGAGDDLDQFLGDVRLPRAVVVERQPVDHVAGVARGVVHRAHARALLACGALKQRAIELDRQVLRQD